MSDKPKIIVSGVNIRKGGTLTIMRSCLEWLSSSDLARDYEVVAVVHKKELFPYGNIKFIEFSDSINSWGKRLWYEYCRFNRLSKQLGNIRLWLSLHDTSPRVCADIKAVYCQTSYPFYKFRWHDFAMDYKIPLFSMLTKFVYKFNSKSTDRFIIQQNWFLKALSKTIRMPESRFILFPPSKPDIKIQESEIPTSNRTPLFFFPSTPDCHKNFEALLEAARILERKYGKQRFKVKITITGRENRYAQWLLRRWGDVGSVEFCGFLSKADLFDTYRKADCLVFPSLIESWGLPISEFLPYKKPMILSDLPYAHETSLGASSVRFVNTRNAMALANAMEDVINQNLNQFKPVTCSDIDSTDSVSVENWNQLFSTLLSTQKLNS